MSKEQQIFWRHLDDVNAGMLGTTQRLHLVPMSHTSNAAQNALWFVTTAGNDLVAELAQGPKPALHIVSDDAKGFWARIEGSLALADDPARLSEIWGTVADVDGPPEPGMHLLKLTLRSAEVWASTGKLGFFYQLAKSSLTGIPPDIGVHFHLSFDS